MTVDRLAYGGEAVGRHHGLVVFVSGAAPGETVRARVRRVQRRHVEADVVAVEKASPERVQPRCVHFAQGCGGCTWQHVDYAGQLRNKETAVRDSLERLGRLQDLPLRPIIPAPSLWHYRNKMEFAFHPEGVLGLHPRGAWHSILRLRECYLAPPLTVALVKAAQAFAREENLSLHDPRTHQGLLRELVVRHSQGTTETMLGIVTSPGAFDAAAAMAERLAAVDASVNSRLAAGGEPFARLSLLSNPWPKRRQRKRRFVNLETLDLLARAMRRGAQLRFATDIDDYAAWTLARIGAHPAFSWRAASALDWTRPWKGGGRPNMRPRRSRKDENPFI